MPWRQSEEDIIRDKISSKNLTLGLFNCDGVVLPHPPILRGLETVKDVVQKAGHTIVEWQPYKHEYAYNLINSIYAGDGGAGKSSSGFVEFTTADIVQIYTACYQNPANQQSPILMIW